jgi:uncharacterized protein (TIGR03435 family)
MNKIAFAIVMAALALAQSEKRAEFEVASIKPTGTKDGSLTFSYPAGGRFSCRNLNVRFLLRIAYDVQDYQIVGGPGWIASEGFDIEARPAAGDGSRDQVREMLRALLADRFQLALHRETRQLPIYALVVGKSGPKLPVADSSASSDGSQKMGQLTTRKMSMASLASLLTFDLKRPVRDETRLAGEFAFTLDWTPGLGESDSGVGSKPSLFAAVQEQLGLKLESKKGPVGVLVIDRVERPSGNRFERLGARLGWGFQIMGYDWPVGFQVGTDLKGYWKLEEHKLGEQIEAEIADVNVRSHTFRFVFPSETERLKVPNACNFCHADKSTNWAGDALRNWANVSPWRVR